MGKASANRSSSRLQRLHRSTNALAERAANTRSSLIRQYVARSGGDPHRDPNCIDRPRCRAPPSITKCSLGHGCATILVQRRPRGLSVARNRASLQDSVAMYTNASQPNQHAARLHRPSGPSAPVGPRMIPQTPATSVHRIVTTGGPRRPSHEALICAEASFPQSRLHSVYMTTPPAMRHRNGHFPRIGE